MSLLSKDTCFCPADVQIWQKMTGFGPTWAQIISVCEFRLLQKHIKVIAGFLRNGHKAYNVIHIEFCRANTPLSTKMVPKWRNFGAKKSRYLAIMVRIRHEHGFSLLKKLIKL